MRQVYHFTRFFLKFRFSFLVKKVFFVLKVCLRSQFWEGRLLRNVYIYLCLSHALFNDAGSIEDEIVSNDTMISDESEGTWKEAVVV